MMNYEKNEVIVDSSITADGQHYSVCPVYFP